jgi:hypothetical protein
MRFRRHLAPQCRVVPRLYEVAAVVAVLLTLTTVQAGADDFNMVPSLGVKSEYNDNIYYSENKTGDLRTSIMPGLELRERTERLDTGLLAKLKGIKSLKNSRFDTVDFRFDGSLAYILSPRWTASAAAEYDRDSNPSLQVSPIAIVTNLVRRYQQQYSLQNGYAISPRTSVTVGYSYTQLNYVTAPLQSIIQGTSPPPPSPPPPPPPSPPPPPLPPPPPPPEQEPLFREVILSSSDVKILNPSLRLAHSFDELTKGTLDIGYTRYLYKYSTVDNYTVTLGLSRALNELWKLSATAGGRFTQSEFSPVKRKFAVFPIIFTDENQARQTSQGYGWVGQLSLAYNGQYSAGLLSLFRDVSTGRLSANERTGVSLDTSYKFTEDLEASFNAEYQINQAIRGEFASETVDDSILRLRAGIRYNFTRDVSLDGGYYKTIANYNLSQVDQNYAYLNLSVKFPMF